MNSSLRDHGFSLRSPGPAMASGYGGGYGGGYGDPYGQQQGGYGGAPQGGWYGGGSQGGYEPSSGYGWGPPPEQQRPPARRPPRRSDGMGSAVAGIFLVLLGAWFLLRDQIEIDIDEWWPIVVVVLGVLMILGAFVRRSPDYR